MTFVQNSIETLFTEVCYEAKLVPKRTLGCPLSSVQRTGPNQADITVFWQHSLFLFNIMAHLLAVFSKRIGCVCGAILFMFIVFVLVIMELVVVVVVVLAVVDW